MKRKWIALAAALCLQAIAWADNTSRDNADRDRALTELQSAAEILKSQNGDYRAAAAIYGGQATQEQWLIYWDENWVQTTTPGTYQLQASEQTTDVPGLGSAQFIFTGSDHTLGSLQLCWQEVIP